MKENNSIIDPAEARSKAERMKSIAVKIEDLLKNVMDEIEKIDNTDTNIYTGTSKSRELREDLDKFKSSFDLTFTQVTKSANDIITIANTMEQQ